MPLEIGSKLFPHNLNSMLIAYTYDGQKSMRAPNHWFHTPAVGKSLSNVPKPWSHTPAVGICLQHGAKHSLWCCHMTLGVLYHLFWPLTDLNPRKMAKTPIFHLSRSIARPHGGQKSLRRVPNHWFHTPAVGKSLWNAPIRWSHTPAVDISLRNARLNADRIHLQWVNVFSMEPSTPHDAVTWPLGSFTTYFGPL